MSKTVDEKVVEMRFDNGQFERNVKTTLSTLDKLKAKLNLTGASKGLEQVQATANKVSFDKMENSLGFLEKRFSTMGIVGMTVIQNLTTSFMGFASKLTSFATGGIIEGGLRRATNLQNAKFQLQGLLKDGEKVAKVMEDVNYGVQDTAYSLDAAANVAAQLAASGLEAGDKMKAALRGVSGVAAMTNSSYEEIGNVFTRVAGQGRVMATDLNSLAARGMNAAATLGQALGKSEAEIRDMVSKGEISFEMFSKAMDDAFGEHAKEANRTMNGALSNIRAALAKIGAEFFEPIIKMDGPLVNMLNAIRERINEIKGDVLPFIQDLSSKVGNIINNIGNKIRNGNKLKYNPFYEGLEDDGKTKKYSKSMEQIQAIAARTGMTIKEVEENVKKLNSRFLIFNSIKNIGESIATVFRSIRKAFSDVFGGKAQDSIFNFAAALNKITTIIKEKLAANADKIYNTFKGLFSILSFGINIIKGIANVIGNLIGSLFGVTGGILNVTSAFGKWVSEIHEGIKKTNAFNIIITKLGEFIRNFTQGLKNFFHGFVDTFGKAIKSIATAIGNAIKRIFTALGNAISSGDASKFMDLFNKGLLSMVLLKAKKFLNYLSKGGTFFDTLKSFVNSVKGIADSIAGVLNTVKGALKTWQNELKAKTLMKIAISIGILSLALITLSDIDKDKLKNALSAITTLFIDLVGALKILMMGNKFTESKILTLAVGLSLAVSILAGAVKKIAEIGSFDLTKSVIAIYALLKMLTTAMKELSVSEKDKTRMIKGATGIIAMALGIKILANAVKQLGNMDLEDLAKGVIAVGALIGALGLFIKKSETDKAKMISAGLGIILLATGLNILSKACKTLGEMDALDLTKGVVAIGIVLKMLESMFTKSKDFGKMITAGIALNIVALSLKQVAKVFKSIAELSGEDIAKGIVAMGVALLGMVKTLQHLSSMSQSFGTKFFDSIKIIFASQALAGMVDSLKNIAKAFLLFKDVSLENLGIGIAAIASSLFMLTIVMEKLKDQDPTSLILCSLGVMLLAKAIVALSKVGILGVATGLIAFAGMFTILGISAKLLKPHISTLFKLAKAILALAGAFAVLGVSMAVVGVGIGVFSTAFILSLSGFKSIGLDTIAIGLVGLAAAFLVVGIAAKKLKPLTKDLFAVSGAMAMLGLSIAAAGVGIALIVQALATMAAVGKEGAETAGLALKSLLVNVIDIIPAIVKQLGLSLVELLKIFKDMIPLIGEILIDTVHMLVEVLITSAPEIARGFFELIVQALTMLNEFVPQIANLLFDFVINTLNTVSIRLPEFVTAIINFLAKLFDAVVQAFKDFGPEGLLKAVVSLGVLTIVMHLMASLVHIVPQAIIGILAFGVLITELAAVIAAVGALSKIPGFKELVTDGGNFLQIIGTAIGQFVGGIVGGIAKGISSMLPAIAEDLSKFIVNLTPFIEGISIVDLSMLEKVGILSASILLLNSAGFISGIQSFLSFLTGNSLANLGTQLTEFINNAKGFIDGVRDISPDMAEGVKILSEAIANLATASFINSISKFNSDKSPLKAFSSELVDFGKGLNKFAESVKDLDVNSISRMTKAADQLVDLTNKLPNRNGLAQWFGGNKSLGLFGGELDQFGKGIKAFCDEIENIEVKNVDKAIRAADRLIDLTNKLPNTGGLAQWFGGSKSLEIFGGQLKEFGKGIKAFCDSVQDMKPSNIDKALEAADRLIDLTNKLPNAGGLAQWFGGSKSLGLFGGELILFAEGIKQFCDKIKDSKFENIPDALKAADGLVDLTNKLPNSLGLAQWFSGGKHLGLFGGELILFAEGLKQFCDKIKDVSIPNNLIDIVNSVKILAEATNNLPDIDGSKLENRAWGFGYGIWHIAEGLNGFFDKLKNVNMDSQTITSCVNSIKTLAETFKELPEVDGGQIENRAWGLGIAIEHYSNAMKGFIDKFQGVTIDPNLLISITQSIKNMGEALGALPDKNGGDIENRAWGLASAMGHFGNSIGFLMYKLTESNFDPEKVKSASESIKTMAEAIKELPDKNGGDIENRSWALGAAIGHFGNGISYLMIKLTESNYDPEKIKSASESIKTMSEAMKELPDKSGSDLENRGWGFGSAMGHFGNGINYLMTQLTQSNFDPEKANKAADLVKTMAEAIKELPDKSGSDIENRAWALGSAMGHFGNGINYLMNKLNDSNFDPEKANKSADIVKSMAETVKELPDKNGGDIENRAWGLGAAIGHFGNGVGHLMNKLNDSNFDPEKANKSADIIKSMAEAIKELPEVDGGQIENRAWGLGEAMKHFGNGIMVLIEEIKNITFDNIDKVIDYIKKISEIVPNIPDNSSVKLLNLSTGLQKIGSGLSDFVNAIKDIDFTNVDISFDNIKKLLESLKSLSDTNIDNINNLSTMIKNVVDALTNLTKVPNDIADNFNTNLQKLGSDGFKSFMNEFSNIENDMKLNGNNAMDGFKSGVNENRKTAIDMIADVYTECKNQFNKDDYVQLGKDFVQGFANGINNNIYLARDAGSDVGKKALIAAKEAIDSNSPSKETYKLGTFFDQGFVNGIKAFGNNIYKESYNVGDRARLGLSKAIKGVSDLILNGIDDDITIRPILDLSNVEDGVATMNGMFRTPSIGVMSNLNAISTGMKMNRQNGGEDIISAINKLGKSLGNTNGDTYNINGITYDDGSNVSEAVQTLVRAARIERRK